MKNNLALFKVDEPKLLCSYMKINIIRFFHINHVHTFIYGLLVICSMNSSIKNDIMVMGG